LALIKLAEEKMKVTTEGKTTTEVGIEKIEAAEATIEVEVARGTTKANPTTKDLRIRMKILRMCITSHPKRTWSKMGSRL